MLPYLIVFYASVHKNAAFVFVNTQEADFQSLISWIEQTQNTALPGQRYTVCVFVKIWVFHRKLWLQHKASEQVTRVCIGLVNFH